MKFLVDWPLGGLVKWLRFCGFDTIVLRLSGKSPDPLPPPTPDTYILTRQRKWARLARPDLLILEAPDSESQLEEVLRRLQISPRDLRPLSRCSHCNAPLVPLARGQVQGRVPDHVFHYQRKFYECPGCRRIYWPGSHLPRITQTLREKLESRAAPLNKNSD
jgi:uncharacterized protein with PIN domain